MSSTPPLVYGHWSTSAVDAFVAELLARLPEPAADEFVESDEWVREIERCLQGVVSRETVCEDWDVDERADGGWR